MDLYLTRIKASKSNGTKNYGDVVRSLDDNYNTMTEQFCFWAVFTMDPPDGSDCVPQWSLYFPFQFNRFLSKKCDRDLYNQQLPICITAYVTISSLDTKGRIKILGLYDDSNTDSNDRNLFEQLFLSLPPNSFQFTLTVNHSSDKFNFTQNNLEVIKFPDNNYGLEMWMEIPEKIMKKWREMGGMVSGLIIGLTLHLDESAVGAVFFEKLKFSSKKLKLERGLFKKWSKRLNEDIDSGMVIQTGGSNNTFMNCHKCVLSARSEVLEAKLNEDNCGDIFGGMTGVVVQAFIKFICSWDIVDAWKNCEIAFELLKAGSKFGMEDLTDAMKQLICFMPLNWISLNMATQLLVYVIKVDDGGERWKEVEKKCMDFFKWFSNDKYYGKLWGFGLQPTFWNESNSAVEFSLLTNEILIFTKCPSRKQFFAEFELDLNPSCSIDKRSHLFMKNLMFTLVGNDLDIYGRFSANLKVVLIMGDGKKDGTLKILMDDEKPSVVNLFVNLAMSQLLPSTYGFNLSITGFRNKDELLITEKNLKVQRFPDGEFGLEVTGVDVGKLMGGPPIELIYTHDLIENMFWAKLNLTLIMDQVVGDTLHWMGFEQNHSKKLTGMLFNRISAPTDLVVRAWDTDRSGEGVKCHKFVLSARSPVFEVMLKADMIESRNNCVEIADMSESAVKTMLRYIYEWDLDDAARDCGVVLELLKAGNKYQMDDLVENLVVIVSIMPYEWFDLDVAEEMLEFSRKVGGNLKVVEQHCASILKCSMLQKRFAGCQAETSWAFKE